MNKTVERLAYKHLYLILILKKNSLVILIENSHNSYSFCCSGKLPISVAINVAKMLEQSEFGTTYEIQGERSIEIMATRNNG